MAAAWIEQKRQYKAYKTRIETLPTSYRAAVAALERYINTLGGMDDADSIIAMLNDLADLFDRAAADGTPIRDIVGQDPVEFIEAFLSNYPSGGWITKEQARLTRAIEDAERMDAGVA